MDRRRRKGLEEVKHVPRKGFRRSGWWRRCSRPCVVCRQVVPSCQFSKDHACMHIKLSSHNLIGLCVFTSHHHAKPHNPIPAGRDADCRKAHSPHGNVGDQRCGGWCGSAELRERNVHLGCLTSGTGPAKSWRNPTDMIVLSLAHFPSLTSIALVAYLDHGGETRFSRVCTFPVSLKMYSSFLHDVFS